MATDGDKKGKEAVEPASGSKPAGARAKSASTGGGKPNGRSGSAANRPASRASAKPGAKGAAAKPAARSTRSSTATAKADKEPRAAAKAKATKADDPSADGTGTGVNREMKRAMKKREGAADRLKRAPTAPSRKRTKPLTFLKEVRGELGRVAWPTRQEVITYSVVVLVTVMFFMIVIAGIDYVALKGVLFLIDRGGR